MKEIWKDIPNYEGYFQVSNLGRVKSLARIVLWGGKPRREKEKIKNHYINREGYPCVTLCKERKSHAFLIHRLVAEAFIPNPENKPFVDHIDTNKENFSLDNLRWVTAKENANNPKTLLHCKENTYTTESLNKRLITRKERGRKCAPKEVYQYSLDGKFINKYESSNEAERQTGILACSIAQVCKQKRYSAGGYLWSYEINQNIAYNKPAHTNSKKVLQYDREGNLIREWASLMDVCKETKWSSPSNLSKAIVRQKFKGQYIWKFKEEILR